MTSEVLEQVLDKFGGFETVILLQPTSPLRTYEDIRNAYELFEKERDRAVISVTQVNEHPEWMYELGIGETLIPFGHNNSTRRQDARKLFIPNGAIYICDRKILASSQFSFRKLPSRAYIMPKDRSIDIDDRLDFDYVEHLLGRNL
jgi:CMP-N-acetylneuraminic acid synthetase